MATLASLSCDQYPSDTVEFNVMNVSLILVHYRKTHS